MKRKTSAQTLILTLLLFLILGMPSLQVTNGYSQTFQLTPETFSSRPLVELQVGDRIEGSFLISNLGPYRNMLNGESVYYWIGVDFKNPNGQTILNYSNYPKGESSFAGSFNYTAVDWGDYSLWIFCGGNFAFENAKYPEMTIDFKVLEAVPTRIDVLSPLNQTYYASSVSLNFAANKPLSWVGYSLDGKDNITIHNNTALTELSNGLHKITVYANNTYGNVVVPETVFFTIEPFPVVPVAIASIALASIIAVGLLLYFKKRKH
jgi:hypothetical protein